MSPIRPLFRTASGLLVRDGELRPPTPPGPRDRAAVLTLGEYIPGDEFTPDSVGVRENYGELQDGPTPNASGVIYLNPGDYHGIRFKGRISANANGLYRFFDCAPVGKNPLSYGAGAEGAIHNDNPNAFFEFYDCDVDGFWWNETQGITVPITLTQTEGTPTVQARQSPYANGVRGRNIKMRRCRVRGFHDAFVVVGDGWDIQGCRATGYYMMGGVGSSADGKLHSDGLQFARGRDGIFKYNFLGAPRDEADYSGDAPQDNGQEDFNNGGLGMFQQENYSDAATQFFRNWEIMYNWVAGGNTIVNMNYKNGNTLSGVKIKYNRLLRRGTTTPVKNSIPAGYPVYTKSQLQADVTENVWWDWDGPITGSADLVPVRTVSV